MDNVIKFLEKAKELEEVHPHLYVELARTRITDYMAWLRVKTNGELLAQGQGQGLSADEACEDALTHLESRE